MGKFDFSGRYKHTDETKERGGGKKGSSVFAFEKEMSFFVPKEGTSKIDILPYKIKTKKHPLVVAKTYSVGDYDYVYDVWVHKYIGPKGDDFLCLKRNFDKACPLCEMAQEAYQAGKQDEYRAFKAKRRCFYNVITHNEGEEDELKIFDTSFEWFEKELCDEAGSDDHDERVDFASPDEGKRVKFRAVPSDLAPMKAGGKVPLKYKGFSFLDRPSIVDRLDDAVSFDEFAVVLSYEELKAAVTGDDEDEDETPAKKPVKVEEEEAPPPKKPKAEGDCPHGHTFGKDCDKHKECSSCKVWKECDRAS